MAKLIKGCFILLIMLMCVLHGSAFAVADTPKEEALKPAFRLAIPFFEPYIYQGQDTDMKKYLHTLSFDGVEITQQAEGRIDKSLSIKNITTDGELTTDYFLPNSNFQYEYQTFYDGKEQRYTFTFEETTAGRYKSTFHSPDGSKDYSLCLVANGEVEEYETGFWIPNSEYGSDYVIQGKNVVFKQVAPGTSWISKYRIQGDWGYVVDVSCAYSFLGFSVETILNRQVQVAKVAYANERKVISDGGGGWSAVPSTASGELWYAKGVGLVRSKGASTSFWNNQASTTKHDTRMIGYIGSGDPLIVDSMAIILGEDNNSFRHNCESFFDSKCSKDNRYDLSAPLFQRLVSDQKKSIKNKVRAAMDKAWAGSCHGISTTIILSKVGNIDINKFEPGTANYFDLSKPYDNQAVKYMINYYQLSQYLPEVQQSTVNATKPGWLFNWGETELKTTLQGIVQKAMDINRGKDPVLISFGWGNLVSSCGHAVIANGYELVNGEHRIQIYDPNYNNEYLYLIIGSDYLSWQLTTSDGKPCYGITDNNWQRIGYLDIQAYNSINIEGYRAMLKAVSEYVPLSEVYIGANNGFTLKNNQGNNLILGEDGLRGDFIPEQVSFINAYTLDGLGSGEMVLSFPENEAYTIIPTHGDIDVSVATPTGFASVKVQNAGEIAITKDGSVKIDNNNGSYTLFVSDDSDRDELIRIDGKNENDVEVKTVADGILLQSDRLDNVHVKALKGTEEVALQFSSQDGRVLIKNNPNSNALQVLESTNKDTVFNKVISQTSDYKEWHTGLQKGGNKEITITFNQDVNPVSVNPLNIFVATDKAGINQLAGISVMRAPNDAKQIKVYPPVQGWQQGGSYYLFIGKNISSTEVGGNLKLKEAIRVQFNIR